MGRVFWGLVRNNMGNLNQRIRVDQIAQAEVSLVESFEAEVVRYAVRINHLILSAGWRKEALPQEVEISRELYAEISALIPEVAYLADQEGLIETVEDLLAQVCFEITNTLEDVPKMREIVLQESIYGKGHSTEVRYDPQNNDQLASFSRINGFKAGFMEKLRRHVQAWFVDMGHPQIACVEIPCYERV
jgi:hypothetical protein